MSDFGEILEKWERRKQRKGASVPDDSDSLAAIVDQYPPDTVENEDEVEEEQNPDSPISVKRLPPEDTLDLHGMTGEEARRKIRRFLTESRARGLRKVLLVHGKGNHSQTEPVLKRVVREELEASPLAGRRGIPSRDLGGSGAVWVAIKHD